MSPIKEAAIKMIQEIPDDKVVYILYILKGINGLFKDNAPVAQKQDALRHIQQFRGKIPSDIDYGEELKSSRAERYADIN